MLLYAGYQWHLVLHSVQSQRASCRLDMVTLTSRQCRSHQFHRQNRKWGQLKTCWNSCFLLHSLPVFRLGLKSGFQKKIWNLKFRFSFISWREKKINQNSLCMSVTFLIQALTHFASPGFNAFLHDGTICLHWSLCTQPVQHLFSASSRFENGKHVYMLCSVVFVMFYVICMTSRSSSCAVHFVDLRMKRWK